MKKKEYKSLKIGDDIVVSYGKEHGNTLYVNIFSGSLNWYKGKLIKEKIDEYIDNDISFLILDFANISFICSSFISIIFLLTKDYPSLKITLLLNNTLRDFFESIGGEENYLLKKVNIK